MIFNLEQQQLYTSKFLNALSVERNLSSKTISAYRCDINGLLTWFHSLPIFCTYKKNAACRQNPSAGNTSL